MKKMIINEEKIVLNNIKKYVSASICRLIREIREMSPLSHSNLRQESTITPNVTWDLEHTQGGSISKYVEIMYYHLKAMKCSFNLRYLCIAVEHALRNGQCIVILNVDLEDLDKYRDKQVIFIQNFEDNEEKKEEIGRRKRSKAKNLAVESKLHKKKYKKQS